MGVFEMHAINHDTLDVEVSYCMCPHFPTEDLIWQKLYLQENAGFHGTKDGASLGAPKLVTDFLKGVIPWTHHLFILMKNLTSFFASGPDCRGSIIRSAVHLS